MFDLFNSLMGKSPSNHIIDWIKKYFIENGPNSQAVIGISGGKDSTVAAALLCKALGPDRVIAVLLPQQTQHDIDIAREVCDYLKIPFDNVYEMNIGNIVDSFYNTLGSKDLPSIVTTNTPARIRMAMLYAIAGLEGGRVCNTCNRSENYIGYSTKYGDHAGDFSPLADYTVHEVIQIGKELNLPERFLVKPPEDGLSGLTDEDNLGFTYETLDEYLLHNTIPEYETYKKIEELHNRNLHKLKEMPYCKKEKTLYDCGI